MEMPPLAHQAFAALGVPTQHARLIRLDAPIPGLVFESFNRTEAVYAHPQSCLAAMVAPVR
ncbi:MAG: hypothetical protein ACTH0Y_03755 [Luteimonas sp.]